MAVALKLGLGHFAVVSVRVKAKKRLQLSF